MALVTTKEMFKKAYEGGYAIGAFNINNMEIIQAITEAAKEEKSPVILQVSAGARKYAKHEYLMALANAAIKDSGIDLALHLDHGADFETCKSCIDGGFTSVMIDGSHHAFADNIELTKKVAWPSWAKLQNSAIVVMVASVIFALVIFGIDSFFQWLMSAIYTL